jgi:hypothetical protein
VLRINSKSLLYQIKKFLAGEILQPVDSSLQTMNFIYLLDSTGPLVSGVIGEKKFSYDVWGDTVNLASRMESSGVEGKINISKDTYEYVKDFFECEYRGQVKAKNRGEVDMYFVSGIKKELSEKEEGTVANQKFKDLLEKEEGSSFQQIP